MLLPLFFAGAVLAPPVDPLPELEKKLDALCARFGGRAGYSLVVLERNATGGYRRSGRTIHHRGDERFPAASTIKTCLMVEAVRQVEDGKIKWTDQREVPGMQGRQASMWSFFFKDGVKVDVDGWTNLMMTVSDNTATMVLREWLGTMNTKARMESLGLPNTMVLGATPPDDEQMTRLRAMFGLGVTTPNEMATLLTKIATGEAAGPAGTDRMLRILGRQYWDDFIGSSVPPDVRTAGKVGAIGRSRSDTAIVYGPTPYVLTLYTDAQKDQRWVNDNEGNVFIRRAANLVWNALNPQRPFEMPKGWEQFGPTGGGVE